VLTALGVVVAALVLAALLWAWFEAGWLRCRILEVEIEGLAPELDGTRIAHLSDLHLGGWTRGRRAVDDAVVWVLERRPDIVCVTGDLVSRRSGMDELERLLGDVGRCYVVLGNHDFADSRDPFSQHIDPAAIEALDEVTLLADEAVELELRGCSVQIVGVDPQTYAAQSAHPEDLADTRADLRVLLCHFPGIARRMPGVFHLILAGHYHAGQIVVPYPGGRVRLAHLRARDVEGVYRYGTTALHVSPGLGTTFVPFRLFARPEVTELVVRSR
jgi:predicted MPP superfamily phosphohydrolase